MHPLRRHTLILLALAVLATGCNRPDERDDGRTTVTFWHSFVSSTIPALEELIARFESEHPTIRIQAQYVPTGDALAQKLITAVRSQSAPDVSWVHANYLESLVKADAIYPMSEFLDGPNGMSEEDLEDIYPALLEYASWNGTLYSLPMEATNLGLLYNKDMFRAAGLDPDHPPRDWDELLAFSKQLVRDTNGDGRNEQVGFAVPITPATGPQGPYMVWQFIPFIWQAGGYMVDEESQNILYGSDEGVRALSFWKELYEAQNLRSFTGDYVPAFASGRAAMILDGPWSLPRYPTLLGDMDWDIAPLPAGPAKRATIVAGEYLAVFKQSKNPEAAWTFIKWITEPDVQAFWSMKSGYLPMRKSVLDEPEYQRYLEGNSAHRAFVEQMSVAQVQRPIVYFPLEIERNLAVAIEKATVSGDDPRAVLAEAVAASNALLQSGNPE